MHLSVPSFQREEGIELVAEAICAGIFNDLGSGSNVDVCVITKVRKDICFDLLFIIGYFIACMQYNHVYK